MAKRSEKPKKSQKQRPQKTLKERRSEKRAAKKLRHGVATVARVTERAPDARPGRHPVAKR